MEGTESVAYFTKKSGRNGKKGEREGRRKEGKAKDTSSEARDQALTSTSSQPTHTPQVSLASCHKPSSQCFPLLDIPLPVLQILRHPPHEGLQRQPLSWELTFKYTLALKWMPATPSSHPLHMPFCFASGISTILPSGSQGLPPPSRGLWSGRRLQSHLKKKKPTKPNQTSPSFSPCRWRQKQPPNLSLLLISGNTCGVKIR